jgi:hypothetical protein
MPLYNNVAELRLFRGTMPGCGASDEMSPEFLKPHVPVKWTRFADKEHPPHQGI